MRSWVVDYVPYCSYLGLHSSVSFLPLPFATIVWPSSRDSDGVQELIFWTLLRFSSTRNLPPIVYQLWSPISTSAIFALKDCSWRPFNQTYRWGNLSAGHIISTLSLLHKLLLQLTFQHQNQFLCHFRQRKCYSPRPRISLARGVETKWFTLLCLEWACCRLAAVFRSVPGVASVSPSSPSILYSFVPGFWFHSLPGISQPSSQSTLISSFEKDPASGDFSILGSVWPDFVISLISAGNLFVFCSGTFESQLIANLIFQGAFSANS